MDLAEANVRAGQLAEAARVLDLLPPGRARAGLEARVALLEAYVALHAGDYEESRAKFETAAQGLEGPERAHAIRLLRFLRLGNAAELQAVAGAHGALLADRRLDAFESLRDGLEHAPVSAARPSLLLWAGELALHADQLSTGQSILRAVFDDYSDSAEAPVALLTLADALVDAGRPDESVPLLERLIIEYPQSAMTPLARRRLAEIRAAVPRL
jgi:TolA-binding protein